MLLDEIRVGQVLVVVAELLHAPRHRQAEQQAADRDRQDVPDARDAEFVDARRGADHGRTADPGRHPQARDRDRSQAPTGDEVVLDALLAVLCIEAQAQNQGEIREQDRGIDDAHAGGSLSDPCTCDTL